jgi:hypothetical protein
MSRLRCVSTTPFGVLVEPELYCTRTVALASMSGAAHSADDDGPDEPGDCNYAVVDVGHHRGVQAVAPFE